MNIARGLWRHVKTGQIFYVEGLSRSAQQPYIQRVIYTQTFTNNLRNTDIKLNEGQLWDCDYRDFLKKFEKMEEDSFKCAVDGVKYTLVRHILSKDQK